MTRKFLNRLVKEFLIEIISEENTASSIKKSQGQTRQHEAMKLNLLVNAIIEILQDTKRELATEEWNNQSDHEKGNVILHKVIDVLETKGYL